MIRLILILICAILITIVTAFLFPFTRLVGLFNRSKRDMICLKFVQTALRITKFLAGAKVEYVGLENLPKKGEPVVYISNHRGFMDIIATYPVLPDRTGFVAKKEMEHWPLISWWMDSVYCLFLDRKNSREGIKAILQGVKYIEQGISMWIFPEGTRSKVEGEMLPFKHGSFKLATKPGVPIVPVAINGAGLLFDDHIPIIKGGPVRIEFLEPIPTKDLTTEEREALPDRVHELIASHVKNCTNGLPPM